MRLSPLQQYVLSVSRASRGKVSRSVFNKFYDDHGAAPQDTVPAITRALERLIDRGLMKGFGIRTPKKWFIKEVRLTPLGKKTAKKLHGEQQRLPFA